MPRFQALGHEVGHFAWYGLTGGMANAGDIPLYPAGYDIYGNDIAPYHARHFNADLLITLIDLWVQDPQLGARTSQACGRWVPWLAWFPIDHSPPAPGVMQRLAHVDYPVQYSKFGMEQVAQAGGPPCRYVPHGVDTKVFRPGDRAAARRKWELPEDAYVVAMVAANKGYPPRKAFPEQMQAFAAFWRRHPEAILYLWSQTGDKMGGVDFAAILKSLDVPLSAVRLVPQYEQHLGIAEADLAQLYQAADVLLAASYGEGFGVPILEAQATGCPVVTTRGTSMTELTVNGIAVPSRQRWWSQLGAWQDTPDVAGIARALESIYQWSPARRARGAARGVRWARRNYSWDVCVRDYWAPLLAEIEDDLEARRHAEAAARGNGTAQQLATYEALAQRDRRAVARTPVDGWYNTHRLQVAVDLLTAEGRPLGRLVDLGAADGGLGTVLEAQGVPCEYVPVELAPSRVQAGRVAYPHWAWRQGAAEYVGTAGEADTVVCLELIEHVVDPAALLRNCVRLLAPGGRLLVATPNDPAGAYVDGVEHLRGYDLAALKAVLAAHGLTVLQTASTVPGLYGPDGLIQHPERLPAYRARLAAADWAVEAGSNLYLLCALGVPAAVAPVPVEVGA